MKKLITFLLCLTILPALLHAMPAALLASKVQQAVLQATLPPSNNGALENNLRLDFFIRESLWHASLEQMLGPYLADLSCKAYALDEHWLIIAGTCMRMAQGDIWQKGDQHYLSRLHRSVFHLDSTLFSNYANNKRVMLVWSDKPLYRAPFVHVLAVSSPAVLAELEENNHQVIIHTARLGRNVSRQRTLEKTSFKENFFKLKESRFNLSGTATDPLFLVSQTKREFLAGYNNGYLRYYYLTDVNSLVNKYDGLPSDTWYHLQKQDLQFIQKTVLKRRPQDWPRIKKRLFYNTTSIPFFAY